MGEKQVWNEQSGGSRSNHGLAWSVRFKVRPTPEAPRLQSCQNRADELQDIEAQSLDLPMCP